MINKKEQNFSLFKKTERKSEFKRKSRVVSVHLVSSAYTLYLDGVYKYKLYAQVTKYLQGVACANLLLTFSNHR